MVNAKRQLDLGYKDNTVPQCDMSSNTPKAIFEHPCRTWRILSQTCCRVVVLIGAGLVAAYRTI